MRIFAGHSILRPGVVGRFFSLGFSILSLLKNLFHLGRSGGRDAYTLIMSKAEFKHERSWL
jgi:hypothetical protein